MRDSVRVSVVSDYEEETARIHDNVGEVTAGDATFSFKIGGSNPTRDNTETEHPKRANECDPCFISPLTEIPTNSTVRCEAVNDRRRVEIILRREDEDVFAWRNSCPHKPKVPLDPGGGAIIEDNQLICHEHGARFECDDGLCTYGPCRGDVLDEIEVEVHDNEVYLSDKRFDACNRLE